MRVKRLTLSRTTVSGVPFVMFGNMDRAASRPQTSAARMHNHAGRRKAQDQRHESKLLHLLQPMADCLIANVRYQVSRAKRMNTSVQRR